MAKKINLSRPHGCTRDEAVAKLRSLTGDVAEKYGLSISDTASGATVSGKGIDGNCRIDDRNVSIELSLGLMLRAFSGRIEGGIKKAMDQHFG